MFNLWKLWSQRKLVDRRTDAPAARQVVVHPILYALFPVFFLYAPNQAFFGLEITFRPAVICVLGATLAWLGLRAVLGDTKRAALTVSLVWLLFFAFDFFRHVASILRQPSFSGFGTAHIIILTSVTATLTVFLASFRMCRGLHQATYLFNVIGTILLCMPLSDLVVGRLLHPGSQELLAGRTALEEGIEELVDVSDRPDIYHIVLDGYGRADQLDRLYGFDNADFLAFLKQEGFYVASQGVANYPQTLLSIASSLNFEYLDKFFGPGLEEVRDRRFVRNLLRHNRTVRLLRQAGYQITSIASPYYEADILPADTVVGDWRYPTVFEVALLDMTPLPWALPNRGFGFAYNIHRSRVLFSLDKLAEMPRLPGPKFVYCHILYAHPPFVFDEDGSPITPDRSYNWVDGEDYFRLPGASHEEYVVGYKGQVRFLNQRLKETLASILANSKQPPIIIVQGDHGSGIGTSLKSLARTDVKERYSILSAYYLPEGGRGDLYESVSPVNSFRIIFNQYFGTSYPLLEDKLYYAPLDRPYDFTLVDLPSFTRNAHQADSQGAVP